MKAKRWRIYAVLGEYTDEGANMWTIARSKADAMRQYVRTMNADVEGDEYAVPIYEKETRGFGLARLKAFWDGHGAGVEAAERAHPKPAGAKKVSAS